MSYVSLHWLLRSLLLFNYSFCIVLLYFNDLSYFSLCIVNGITLVYCLPDVIPQTLCVCACYVCVCVCCVCVCICVCVCYVCVCVCVLCVCVMCVCCNCVCVCVLCVCAHMHACVCMQCGFTVMQSTWSPPIKWFNMAFSYQSTDSADSLNKRNKYLPDPILRVFYSLRSISNNWGKWPGHDACLKKVKS